jgi:heme/copper-type cytochrome/quinol oxidase subunit 2
MKYLIPIILFLAGCSHTVKEMSHPIEVEKQQELQQTPAPILTVDLFKLSVVVTIIATLVLLIWWFVRKSQNNEGSAGSE